MSIAFTTSAKISHYMCQAIRICYLCSLFIEQMVLLEAVCYKESFYKLCETLMFTNIRHQPYNGCDSFFCFKENCRFKYIMRLKCHLMLMQSVLFLSLPHYKRRTIRKLVHVLVLQIFLTLVTLILL